MKTMNEFESVIVIAGLIIAACATMDLPPAAPDGAAGRQGRDYSGSAMTQSFDLAQQATAGLVGSGAVPKSVSMTGPGVGNGRGHTQMLVMRSPLQTRNSW